MRIRVHAVGRLKAGPERILCERYLDRATKAGRALGISEVSVREIADARTAQTEQRIQQETAALLESVEGGAYVLALDERGASMDSRGFAMLIDRLRHERPALSLLIGGADGLGDAARQKADGLMALGSMTWPHQIVRMLVLEQTYRAMTLLSGHPYHRD